MMNKSFQEPNLTMLTDFYELTMANGYFANGFQDTICYFDMFFRKVPDNGGFAIMAGVEQLVEYLQNLTFTEAVSYTHLIEKIKNVFLAILRDIKKDIDNGEQPGEAVNAAMFQAMRDALAEQKQNPLSIDDVTAMIAGQIGQLTPMDEETVELFQQFAKKMIEQAGQ